VRSFLAVGVREPALSEARRLLGEIAASLPRDQVRWARGEGLHITLHFFGELDEARVGEVLEAVAPAAEAAAPFDLELGGLGSFPARGAPRVLWLGVTGGREPLSHLAAACHQRLRGAGFDVEDRPFSAHCTLGRPRAGWPPAARSAWSEWVSREIALPPFPASGLTLYRSRPQPGGAEYSNVAELPLNAG
jgi:2'-5' RNA ligase